MFSPGCRSLIWPGPTDKAGPWLLITSNSQLSGWKNRFYIFPLGKTILCASHFWSPWSSVGTGTFVLCSQQEIRLSRAVVAARL